MIQDPRDWNTNFIFIPFWQLENLGALPRFTYKKLDTRKQYEPEEIEALMDAADINRGLEEMFTNGRSQN